jgi:hypothetical protein
MTFGELEQVIREALKPHDVEIEVFYAHNVWGPAPAKVAVQLILREPS